ncbi:MAG: restriction endonuclease subunit S [Acidobacteria bacterium]|nr:restriction endonuclease subunit S [Acidobacteriota bacterium]
MEVRPGYKQTEVGVIPEDWEVARLGDLATIRDGTHQTPKYVPDGIPFYSVEHVTSGDFTRTKFISIKEHRFLTRSYKIERGDILMTRIGSIGDCRLIDWDVHASFYVSLALLKVYAASAAFISQYSHSKAFKSEVELRSLPSATPKKINLGPISDIRVPLPPLPEQNAIAASLNDVDALVDGLTRLIAKKRDLKQAAMQQLLTGQTRLPGFHGEWEVKRLGDVVDADPDNLGAETHPNFAFNYVALEDVDRGVLRSHTERVFASAPSRARRTLSCGDVLVSTVRPNLQSHLLFAGGAGNWVCSTGFCVVRCRGGVTNPAFIFNHLFGGDIIRQIDALLTGSNYPAINSGDVQALTIPLPDFAEQTAIAAVLSDMDAELAALEARRDKTRALKQAMMQELLTGRTRLV